MKKQRFPLMIQLHKTQVKMASLKIHESASMDTLLPYTKNWPAESVATFKASVQNGKPFKIAFLGSNAQGEGEQSWPQMVQTALTETFDDHISVSTFSYDVTSTEFVEQDMQADLVKEQPDLVLFEPFTLKDNGVVEINESLDNVSSVIDSIKGRILKRSLFCSHRIHCITPCFIRIR